jgi:hypothetical protein
MSAPGIAPPHTGPSGLTYAPRRWQRMPVAAPVMAIAFGPAVAGRQPGSAADAYWSMVGPYG